MKWRRNRGSLVVVVVAALLLAALSGCAETEFLAHAAKQFQTSAGLGDSVGQSVYKIGEPYEINGVWYYPKVDYDYSETGIASWYGPKFHGKATANGEVFDMNRVSAAHRTLPLPSIVRVTNLKSGRAVNIRVNDRGPFAHGRIIDLSRRAAQLLGFEREGTAPVRVDILAEESRQIALQAQTIGGGRKAEPAKPDAAPTVVVTSSTLSAPPGAKTATPPSDQFAVKPITTGPATTVRGTPALAAVDGEVTVMPVVGTPQIYVQAGAFSLYQNAYKVHAVLKQLGPAKITQIDRNQRPLFRVRIGPLQSVDAADQVLASVIRAGYPEAATVVE